MKRHLSILYPAARITLPWVALVCVVMAVVQIGAFFMGLGETALPINYYPSEVPFAWAVEKRVTLFSWGFRGMLFLLPVLLAWLVNRSVGKDNLALKRLRIQQGTAALWMGAWNTGCLLLLWGTELLVVLICWGIYCGRFEPVQQELFLSFWQSKLLHSLLPLSDIARYIRNLTCMAALGMMSAMGWARPASKGNYIIVIPALVFSASFPGGVVIGGDIFYSVVAVLFLAALVCLYRKREEAQQ